MIVEGYLLLWSFIIFLILLAEWGSLRKYTMGVLAGLLILLSGLYFLVDGIQVKTGELKQVNYNLLQNTTKNITNDYIELHEQTNNTTLQIVGNNTGTQTGNLEGIQTGTEQVEYIYTDLNPQPNLFSFTGLLGLVQVLVGFYITIHYSLRLK